MQQELSPSYIVLSAISFDTIFYAVLLTKTFYIDFQSCTPGKVVLSYYIFVLHIHTNNCISEKKRVFFLENPRKN